MVGEAVDVVGEVVAVVAVVMAGVVVATAVMAETAARGIKSGPNAKMRRPRMETMASPGMCGASISSGTIA